MDKLYKIIDSLGVDIFNRLAQRQVPGQKEYPHVFCNEQGQWIRGIKISRQHFSMADMRNTGKPECFLINGCGAYSIDLTFQSQLTGAFHK
jgi:hypothetical protein